MRAARAQRYYRYPRPARKSGWHCRVHASPLHGRVRCPWGSAPLRRPEAYYLMAHACSPSVFSLAWPWDRDAARWPLGSSAGVGAAAGGGRPRLLLFRRAKDGRLWADDFLDEADVCAEAVAVLDPAMIRLERERLYLTVANGVAVYVPVGPSPLPHCTRYGRLYLRRAVGEGR